MGVNGLEFVRELQEVVNQSKFETQIVAASVQSVYHIEKLACFGVDYCTLTYEQFSKIINNVLTDEGIQTFMKDWENIN